MTVFKGEDEQLAGGVCSIPSNQSGRFHWTSFRLSQVGFFPRFTDHIASWLYCFLFPGLLIPWSLGVTSLFPGFSWSKWLLTGQLAWMLACFFLLLRAGSITLGDLSCWVVIVRFNICNWANRVSFFLSVRWFCIRYLARYLALLNPRPLCVKTWQTNQKVSCLECL